MIKDDLCAHDAHDRHDLVSAAIAPQVKQNMKTMQPKNKKKIVESAVARALADFAKRIQAEKRAGERISAFQKEVLAKIAVHISPKNKKLVLKERTRARISAKLSVEDRKTLNNVKI